MQNTQILVEEVPSQPLKRHFTFKFWLLFFDFFLFGTCISGIIYSEKVAKFIVNIALTILAAAVIISVWKWDEARTARSNIVLFLTHTIIFIIYAIIDFKENTWVGSLSIARMALGVIGMLFAYLHYKEIISK